MRAKISFLRQANGNNQVPLHHQKIIYTFINEMAGELGIEVPHRSFSSLKGTSKVKNGFMRFLSTKITLVLASPDDKFMKVLTDHIMTKDQVLIGKLELAPKQITIIDKPNFDTRTKYVCISPLVLCDPNQNEEQSQEFLNPSSHEFSDMLFNELVEKMEQAGFTEAQLNSYAEFEVIPDPDYINKLNDAGKKFARYYRSDSGKSMAGYLLPFTLHAHPEVHEFIWEYGLGALNSEGYGMVDTVVL